MNGDRKRMPGILSAYIRASLCHVFIRSYAGDLLENLENRNGMVVAQGRAIAFVPTKLGRG